MAKKAKRASQPKVQNEAVVRVNCASSEVMIALRAYLGGVKTGLGKNPSKAGKKRLQEISDQEKTLLRMEKILEKAQFQSRGVTVIFTKDLDRVNNDLASVGARTLGPWPIKK